MSYSDVIKSKFDAGIYREYIVKNYGDTLTSGGTYNSYRMAMAHCHKLSRIVKIPIKMIISDIKCDYESMEE